MPFIITPGIDIGPGLSIIAESSAPPTVEALVVAGGGPGGGGPYNGGGGGAGGVIYNSALSVNSSTSYTVTVGAGGTGVNTQGTNGLTSALFFNNSYSFNGSNQSLEVAANNVFAFGTGNFTVEGWFYNTSFPGSGAYNHFFDFRSSGASTTGWTVGQFSTAGQLVIYSGSGQVLAGTTNPVISTWNHFAVTRVGSTVTLYLNGISIGTWASSTNFTDNICVIGRYASSAVEYFNGYLSNLRVVKGVAVYTGNFTVPTSPLTATQSAGTNISAITGTQTSLLTLQNATIVDNSTYALSITNTGGVAFSNNSPFGITTAGGGAGGSHPALPQTGLAGGSGGGGSQAGGAGGAGTAGQGNAGGGLIYAAGGGGGGAGAAVLTPGMTAGPYTYGTAPVTGGIGLQFSISGTSTYYGGGGGGGGRATLSVPQGPGGLGGGGAGGAATGTNPGTAGTVNTGGGGGGIGSNSEGGVASGGSGGSGIVIIRYADSYRAATGTTGSPTITTTGGYRIYTWTSSGSITF